MSKDCIQTQLSKDIQYIKRKVGDDYIELVELITAVAMRVTGDRKNLRDAQQLLKLFYVSVRALSPTQLIHRRDVLDLTAVAMYDFVDVLDENKHTTIINDLRSIHSGLERHNKWVGTYIDVVIDTLKLNDDEYVRETTSILNFACLFLKKTDIKDTTRLKLEDISKRINKTKKG